MMQSEYAARIAAVRTFVANYPKRLSALSRLFSSTVFREMAVKGKSATFTRLVREAELLPRPIGSSLVRDVFELAFEALKGVGLRDEYIYKAALTHRVLLGKHSLRTACMLSEFRAGDCKADIAILNGTTTVYEIKSERDSLSRLERQIENYRQVFASVYVIAGENHVDAILKATAKDVGVMSLDRRYYISTRREASNLPGRINPITVFEALRTNEATDILKGLGVDVPVVPNTRLRAELRKRFELLHPEDVHAGMLSTLKRTRDMQPLSALVDRLPLSLQAAALSVPLRRGDHERLVDTINTPLRDAMAWA
jgi:hypothetical protein